MTTLKTDPEIRLADYRLRGHSTDNETSIYSSVCTPVISRQLQKQALSTENIWSYLPHRRSASSKRPAICHRRGCFIDATFSVESFETWREWFKRDTDHFIMWTWSEKWVIYRPSCQKLFNQSLYLSSFDNVERVQSDVNHATMHWSRILKRKCQPWQELPRIKPKQTLLAFLPKFNFPSKSLYFCTFLRILRCRKKLFPWPNRKTTSV